MPAPERPRGLRGLRGLHAVADPAALNAARWSGADMTILRLAPDEAFAIGATDATIDDEHAIVEEESGFVGGWVDLADVSPHIEWPIPMDRPVLAQGSIAGVPAKLWLPADDGTGFLVVAAAYADELHERLR